MTQFDAVSSVIKARKSVRAFTERAVSKEDINAIFEASRFAPSGTNTQPWSVHVVTGVAKDRIIAELLAKFDDKACEKMDYQYYPKEWISPYKQRRLACGLALYSALKIKREDKSAQRAHWRRNFEAFNAPTVMFFTINAVLEKGSYLDYGMFLQNVSLAATAKGIATCAQAALANYPDVIRKHLDLPEDQLILCGMGIGYEDEHHPLNQYRTEREPVNNFVSFTD